MYDYFSPHSSFFHSNSLFCIFMQSFKTIVKIINIFCLFLEYSLLCGGLYAVRKQVYFFLFGHYISLIWNFIPFFGLYFHLVGHCVPHGSNAIILHHLHLYQVHFVPLRIKPCSRKFLGVK